MPLSVDEELELETESWHKDLRALYAYWLSIHPSEGMLPSRADFDPLEVHTMLSKIWMLDVHHDPLRLKFRIVGTELVKFLQVDPTGEWLLDAFPDAATSAAHEDYCSVANTKKPHYRCDVPQYIVPDYRHIERLLLPLVDENQQCNIILGISIYT